MICVFLGAILFACTGVGVSTAWSDESLVDKTKESVNGALDKAKSTAQESTDKIDQTWQAIDQNTLKNRTRDEIVAWVIMGILVAGVAGLFTPFKNTGLGWVARFGIGLAGAIIGGVITYVTKADFGMGPVLIRYEDLLFALIGAVVLVVGFRTVVMMMQRKEKK